MIKNTIKILCVATCVFFSCTKRHFPTIIEMEKNENGFFIKDHQMGQFLFGINPIEYSKNKTEIKLKGILSYPGKDKYSMAFDTLLSGVGIVEIYYGKIKSGKVVSLIQIGKTDCNGKFEVVFKRSTNSYLFFYSSGFTATGFSSINYFESYEKEYKSNIVLVSKCD